MSFPALSHNAISPCINTLLSIIQITAILKLLLSILGDENASSVLFFSIIIEFAPELCRLWSNECYLKSKDLSSRVRYCIGTAYILRPLMGIGIIAALPLLALYYFGFNVDYVKTWIVRLRSPTEIISFLQRSGLDKFLITKKESEGMIIDSNKASIDIKGKILHIPYNRRHRYQYYSYSEGIEKNLEHPSGFPYLMNAKSLKVDKIIVKSMDGTVIKEFAGDEPVVI